MGSLADLESFVDETLNKKCDVESSENCSEKEQGYIKKMREKPNDFRKGQIKRLEGIQDTEMKPELKSWLFSRLHILKELEREEEAKPESTGADDKDEF